MTIQARVTRLGPWRIGILLVGGVGLVVLSYGTCLRDNSRLTLHGNFGCVWTVAFSPDGRTLAAGGGGTQRMPDGKFRNVGCIKLWGGIL